MMSLSMVTDLVNIPLTGVVELILARSGYSLVFRAEETPKRKVGTNWMVVFW